MAKVIIRNKSSTPIPFGELLAGNFFRWTRNRKIYYKLDSKVVTDIRNGRIGAMMPDDKVIPVSLKWEDRGDDAR